MDVFIHYGMAAGIQAVKDAGIADIVVSGLDADRIGVWGISYSGGHALILAAIDPRVKTIVSQIPVIDNGAADFAVSSERRSSGY